MHLKTLISKTTAIFFLKKWVLSIIVLMSVVQVNNAQELKCNISVNSQSIQGTNKQVFETMQTSLTEFMNNQRWTDRVYAPNERIECTMQITIKEVLSVTDFKGTIQVQSRRPTFGASYNTTLFNYLDNDFQIKYVEFQPMVFNPNTFDSNLIALMAFYAYMIIGMDDDSFELNGGSGHFRKAEEVVNRAQNAAESGWKSFENRRNRYWLVENVLNEYHKPLRLCVYKYHREGLDLMSTELESGRTNIADGLDLLRKVFQQVPSSFLMHIFFSAKVDEIVDIFSEAPTSEKSKVSALMTQIDPTNIDKYKVLTSNN